MPKTTPQNTSGHPNALGAGSLEAVFSRGVDITTFATDADSLNCLYIAYIPEIPANGTPAVTPHAATVQVDGDGAGTQARITLTVKNHDAAGAANSDVTFTIDCDGSAKTAWSSNAAVAYSLKDIIDLINEATGGGTNGNLLSGFRCWIADGGMYDLVCNGASHFLDDAEEYILPPGTPGTPTAFLRRDMAVHTIDSDFLLYWRLGMPEAQDRGLFKLLDLYGTIGTDTGGTNALNGGVLVVRDDYDDFVEPTGTWATDIANHEEVAQVDCADLPSGSGGANWLEHNPTFAPAQRGPLVVIVKADTGAAQTAKLRAHMQAVVV